MTAYKRACFCGPELLTGDAIPVRHIGPTGIPMPTGASTDEAIFVQGPVAITGIPNPLPVNAGLTNHPLTSALGSVIALGDIDSDAPGAGDVPVDNAGWVVSAGAATHVLDSFEAGSGPWHDAAHAVVLIAATAVYELWRKVGTLWQPLSAFTFGNGAAVAASPNTVVGGISFPFLRGSSRFYWRFVSITDADHVTISSVLSGGVPL